MLFKYNFVNHDAEIMQKLIEHIVLDVWCNAKGKNFNLNKIKEEKIDYLYDNFIIKKLELMCVCEGDSNKTANNSNNIDNLLPYEVEGF